MAQCNSELPRMPAFDRARRSFQQRYTISEEAGNDDQNDGAGRPPPFSEALEARNSRNDLPSRDATTRTSRRVSQEPGLAALRSLSNALHEIVSSSISGSTGSSSSLGLYRCLSSCVFDSLSELRAGCLLGTPVWPAVLLKSIDCFLLEHIHECSTNDGGSIHRNGSRLFVQSQAAVIEDGLKTLAEFAATFGGESLSLRSSASTQEWPVLAMAAYEFGSAPAASVSHDWSAGECRRSSLDRVVLIRLGNGIACDCHVRDLLNRLLGPIASIECPENGSHSNSSKNGEGSSVSRRDCEEKGTPLTPTSGGLVGTTPLSSEVNNTVGERPAVSPEWAFVELPSVGAAQRAVRLLESGLDLTPLGGPKHALCARLFRGYGTPIVSTRRHTGTIPATGAGLSDSSFHNNLEGSRSVGVDTEKEDGDVISDFYEDEDEDDDVIVAGDEDDVEDIVLDDEDQRATFQASNNNVYFRQRPLNGYEEFDVHNDEDEDEDESNEDEVAVGSEEDEDFGGRGPMDSLAPVMCLVCGADYEATSNYASHCVSRRHTDALQQQQEARRSPRAAMRDGLNSVGASTAAAFHGNATNRGSLEHISYERSSVLPPDLPSLSPQDLPPLSPPDLPSLSERRRRHHSETSAGAPGAAAAASPGRSNVVASSATPSTDAEVPGEAAAVHSESPGGIIRTQEAARRIDEWRAAVKVFRGGQWVDNVVASLEAAVLEPGSSNAPARASAEAALTRAYAARLAASYNEHGDDASESQASACGSDQAALERAAKLLLARPVPQQQEELHPPLSPEVVEDTAQQRASLLEEALLGERLRSAALMRTLRVTEKARATLVAQVLNGRSAASREVARAAAAESQANDLRAQVASLQVALEAAERRAEDARTSARASAQRARVAEAQTIRAEEQAAQAERRDIGPWNREEYSAGGIDNQLTSALSLLEALGRSGDGSDPLRCYTSFGARGATFLGDSQRGNRSSNNTMRLNSEDCARAMQSTLADDAFFTSRSSRGQRRSDGDSSEQKQHEEEGTAASAAVAVLERMEVGLQTTASLVRAEKEARSRRQLEVC